MKHIIFLFLISGIAFCACQKGENNQNNTTSNATKLVGKWTPKTTKSTINFDDGKSASVDIPSTADDFVEFKITKNESTFAEGTFITQTMGTSGNGTWRLENEVEMTLIYTSLGNYTLYRFLDEINDKSLILSADDKLTLLWAELNDMNSKLGKTIVGGSVFEEYFK